MCDTVKGKIVIPIAFLSESYKLGKILVLFVTIVENSHPPVGYICNLYWPSSKRLIFVFSSFTSSFIETSPKSCTSWIYLERFYCM